MLAALPPPRHPRAQSRLTPPPCKPLLVRFSSLAGYWTARTRAYSVSASWVSAFQDFSIMQNAITDSGSDLFTIIGISKLVRILLVRDKSAFYQHRGMSHICQHKELLRFGAPVYRVSSPNQSVLNKAGQALAFYIRGLSG